MESNSIICFTVSFPHGNRETYFENELPFLADAFDTVYIVPLYNPYGKQVRKKLPSNVIVSKPIAPQKFARVFKGLMNFSDVGPYVYDFFANRVFLSAFRLKKWFNSLLIYRLSVRQFAKMKKEVPSDAILYSYWAEVPLFASDLCIGYLKIVRMHGADFYLNRNKGYLPIRKEIYKSATYLCPISLDITNILLQTYTVASEKIRLSYLGTRNNSLYCSNNKDSKLKVISCSHVYPLKRVHLIFESLIKVNPEIEIEWHHMGEGESMEYMRDCISRKIADNIKVTLHGWVSQERLMEIYQSNYFHWFVNVSEYEGLPVSIMESFSFGIPVIATDVGGTREIVNEQNGVLINKDFAVEELARLLESYRSPAYLNKRVHAFETWNRNFNADINYTNFAGFISGLRNRNLTVQDPIS